MYHKNKHDSRCLCKPIYREGKEESIRQLDLRVLKNRGGADKTTFQRQSQNRSGWMLAKKNEESGVPWIRIVEGVARQAQRVALYPLAVKHLVKRVPEIRPVSHNSDWTNLFWGSIGTSSRIVPNFYVLLIQMWSLTLSRLNRIQLLLLVTVITSWYTKMCSCSKFIEISFLFCHKIVNCYLEMV